MPTWLNVKEAVAENLGKTDGSTYNAKREGALLRARRKYYSEEEWSFCGKVGATLTFTANVATMPSDYNDKFNPKCVYKYVGNLKYEYRQVEWYDLAAYGTLDYVYALNPVAGTIKISQNDATLSIDYTYLPADYTSTTGGDDATVEPAPDTTAIELLGTAYFFMSSRQSKGSYQQFLDGYKAQLNEDKKANAKSTPTRYFREFSPRLNTGYRGGR